MINSSKGIGMFFNELAIHPCSYFFLWWPHEKNIILPKEVKTLACISKNMKNWPSVENRRLRAHLEMHARVISLTDKFIRCYGSILWWYGHPLIISVSLWVFMHVRFESSKMPPGTVMTRVWQNWLSVELSSLKDHFKVTARDYVFVSKVLRWHGLVPSWGGYLAIPSVCLKMVKMWKI